MKWTLYIVLQRHQYKWIMHFRICVALVVREFTAHSLKLPAADVTCDMIMHFIKEHESYNEVAQCAFVALCGVESTTVKGLLTVVDWLRNPQRLTSVSS